MLAFETFGGLDGERLAVAIRGGVPSIEISNCASAFASGRNFVAPFIATSPSPNPPRPRVLRTALLDSYS
jgi:hypothetical protein